MVYIQILQVFPLLQIRLDYLKLDCTVLMKLEAPRHFLTRKVIKQSPPPKKLLMKNMYQFQSIDREIKTFLHHKFTNKGVLVNTNKHV